MATQMSNFGLIFDQVTGSAPGHASSTAQLYASSSTNEAGTTQLFMKDSSGNEVPLGGSFKLEDGDGTELAISGGAQVKFVEGNGGVDINWTDTDSGSDGDEFDLTFTLDLNGVSAADVDVANDSIAIIDANDSNGTKKESIADLVGAIAGTVTSTGLSDSAGVLKLDIQNMTAQATVDDADLIVIDDGAGGTLRKMTRANFIESAALDAIDIDGGAIDGAVIGANNAAAGTFTSLVAGGNVDLGDATSDTITATGRFDSDLVPSTDSARDLGSSTLQWAELHVDTAHIDALGGNLDAGDKNISNLNALTASAIQVNQLDVVTINSVTQSDLTLEIEDKLIVSALSASSANSDGGGLRIGGGSTVVGHAGVLWNHASSSLDFSIGDESQVMVQDGAFVPSRDDNVDLGASGAQWKDLYVDGVANLDSLKMPDVTSGKLLVADGTSYEEVALSGDATLAANGALTIAAGAVEHGMLNDNVISGQAELAHADIADADDMMISDATDGVVKKVGVDSLRDHFFGVVSGDATVADGGALTLAAAQTNVTSMFATDLKIGEDDQTKIDFETADEIHFYAANAEQVFVSDGVLGPQTDSDVDLGADGVAFKKLFVDDIDLNGQGRIDLDADGDTSIRSAADDQIQLEVGGSDMVTVLSTGVGVNGGYGSGNGISLGADGTVNADSNLNLGADGSGASIIAYGATANERFMYDNTNHVIQFRNSSAATMLTLGGDSNSEFALDVADGANNINKVRAAAFVTYSDESLKEDVQTMNTALDTVMSLEGVEFTWKNSGERDFGFIAQDVQKVVPKAVHTASDGVQGVDYSRLTSVLVEAVKAQQVQIEDLKKVISNLKK